MSELKLKGFSRTEGNAKSNKELIPAEIYGPAVENEHILVNYAEMEKIYAEAGMATIIDLEVDGKTHPVIIKEIQRDPLKSRMIHIDLYEVKADKKVVVNIELNPVGKSYAISNMGCILIKNMQKLKVECLPKDLVKAIDVDLAALNDPKVVIRVADLNLPAGMVAKIEGRAAVFSVMASRKTKSAAKAEPAPKAKK